MNIKVILLTFASLFFLGNSTSRAQSQNNDNDSIRSIIEKKRAYNNRKGIGYRIQLYNGSEKRVYALDQHVSWGVIFSGCVAESGSRTAETLHRDVEDGAHSRARTTDLLNLDHALIPLGEVS